MIVVEGRQSFWVGTPASIIEDTRELAWAESYVHHDPTLKWIVGRYVEAEKPNENGHVFPLEDLRVAHASIANKPLNLLHQPHQVVGHYVASELLYPQGEAAQGDGPAHVEALAAFYRYYFPEEYQTVEKAHSQGQLWFSMEAIPETLTCLSDGCGAEYEYDGRQSDTYVCGHLNTVGARKQLNKPTFLGGALIYPPVRPGWKRASVTEMSELMMAHAEAGASTESTVTITDTSVAEWESMMASLLRNGYEATEGEWARSFSPAQRKAAAKSGTALPDGSFPIQNDKDLSNAIHAFGRANAGDRSKVKSHIVRRAKALGKTAMLPAGWAS